MGLFDSIKKELAMWQNILNLKDSAINENHYEINKLRVKFARLNEVKKALLIHIVEAKMQNNFSLEDFGILGLSDSVKMNLKSEIKSLIKVGLIQYIPSTNLYFIRKEYLQIIERYIQESKN